MNGLSRKPKTRSRIWLVKECSKSTQETQSVWWTLFTSKDSGKPSSTSLRTVRNSLVRQVLRFKLRWWNGGFKFYTTHSLTLTLTPNTCHRETQKHATHPCSFASLPCWSTIPVHDYVRKNQMQFCSWDRMTANIKGSLETGFFHKVGAAEVKDLSLFYYQGLKKNINSELYFLGRNLKIDHLLLVDIHEFRWESVCKLSLTRNRIFFFGISP